MIPELKNRYSIEGKTYEPFKQAYFSLLGSYFTCLDIISRQIGGVYVDRSFINQKSSNKPFTPVPYSIQTAAMDALSEYGFSDKKLLINEDIFSYLQSQRRGFNFRSSGEDPKILSTILLRQNRLLSQLLNPRVLTRINNSSLYGNKYTLAEYMIDLRKAIFMQDMFSSVSKIRQNIQVSYLNQLLNISSKSSKYDNLSKSAAFYNLNWLQDNLDPSTGDLSSRQHKKYLLYLIENFKTE